MNRKTLQQNILEKKTPNGLLFGIYCIAMFVTVSQVKLLLLVLKK